MIETRDRDVAYKVYWPNVVDSPVPVVIFSHGLGGTRDAAAYLGRALADAGYVSIHIQHPGSDHNAAGQFRSRQEAKKNLRQSLRNRKNLVNRLQDIPFVLDEVTRRNRSGPWSGRFDLSRIGMAGHSYGARSTMFAAGETVGRAGRSVKERRIKAGVVLSPNLPNRQIDPANSYGEIDIPLLHITGTLDADPIRGGRSASRRTKPYELIPAGKQYLLVLEGADHATFSGHRLSTGSEKPKDKVHIAAISRAVIAFFDGYLRGDSSRTDWLQTNFARSLAPGDRFDFR